MEAGLPLSLSDEEADADSTPQREPLGDRINNFIGLRLLITPWLIEVVFWVGVIACIGDGSMMIGESFNRPDHKTDHFSTTTFALGWAILLLGPLMLHLSSASYSSSSSRFTTN